MKKSYWKNGMSGVRRRPRRMLSRRSEVLKHARASRSDAKTGSEKVAVAAARASKSRNKVPYAGTPPGSLPGCFLDAFLMPFWMPFGRLLGPKGVPWSPFGVILGCFG